MNTKEITKPIIEAAKKLDKSDDQEKQFAEQLAAIAQKIEAYRKSKERPITEETLKQIHVPQPIPGFNNPKFTPRRP